MAEGFAREMAGADFDIRSAGISAGGVNSDAIEFMKEAGIDISAQTSDSLTPAHYEWADYVVTVCDSARDRCPVVPPGKTTVHWSVPDPYGDYNSAENKAQTFREVREMLRMKISELLESIRAGAA